MMKKTLFRLFCLSILCFCLTGCFESSEEKQKRQEYFNQAKENAVSYIQKKYGFTPEVGTAKCTYDNSDSFSSNCTGMIIVNAKHNGKWFEVLINGTMSTDEGSDNYQYEQISNDIINLIASDFSQPYKYKIYYGYDGDGIIDTYYDGNNLSNIMENDYLKCVTEYVDHSYLENNKTKLSTSKYSIFFKLFIINYKSVNSYKKIKYHDYNITGSYIEDYFYDNSEYLKDVLTLNVRNVKYYSF